MKVVALLAGNWEGNRLAQLPNSLDPDFGPSVVDPAAGVVLVGATPWVVNYNVCLQTTYMALARDIARAVSARSGGLPDVQAMALRHEDSEKFENAYHSEFRL